MTESSGEPRQDGDTRADGASDVPELPRSLTFRITRITLLVILVLAICMTPVAWAAPWTLSLYLIPLVLIVWVLRARTVVTTDAISARMLRTRRVSWSEVRSFRLDQRRWLRAVLRDDAGAGSPREVLLPAVRVRDLPRLAAMSGGRLPDLTATTDSKTTGSKTTEPHSTDSESTRSAATEDDSGESGD